MSSSIAWCDQGVVVFTADGVVVFTTNGVVATVETPPDVVIVGLVDGVLEFLELPHPMSMVDATSAAAAIASRSMRMS